MLRHTHTLDDYDVLWRCCRCRRRRCPWATHSRIVDSLASKCVTVVVVVLLQFLITAANVVVASIIVSAVC